MSEPMKGITCCGDCVYYNFKKHKCTRGATNEGDAQDHFYADCPLPNVILSEWINASEKLPTVYGFYLVAIPGGIAIAEWVKGNAAYMEDDSFVIDNIGRSRVKFWMPLPNSPKEF